MYKRLGKEFPGLYEEEERSEDDEETSLVVQIIKDALKEYPELDPSAGVEIEDGDGSVVLEDELDQAGTALDVEGEFLYECSACPEQSLSTLADVQKHMESEEHLKRLSLIAGVKGDVMKSSEDSEEEGKKTKAGFKKAKKKKKQNMKSGDKTQAAQPKKRRKPSAAAQSTVKSEALNRSKPVASDDGEPPAPKKSVSGKKKRSKKGGRKST